MGHYAQVIKSTQAAARKVARETGKPASERTMITYHENEHGFWRIEREGDRYTLWLAKDGRWALVANQGRRKTCIELADANYRGGTSI
jgi:uncharacterized protein YbdZ (MbtH family)